MRTGIWDHPTIREGITIDFGTRNSQGTSSQQQGTVEIALHRKRLIIAAAVD
jgi:hypothetical protein